MIKKIYNTIVNLFSNKKETQFFSSRLLKIDRGQSFKGHAAELTLHNNILCLNNVYFSGNVVSMYNSDENSTKLTITHNFNSPKWLKDKLGVNWVGGRDYQIDDTTLANVNEWGVNFARTTKHKGLCMKSHKENINILKELSNDAAKFRRYLKSLDSNQMHAMLHSIDVTPKDDEDDGLPF
jgi:hypothetical protein